MPMWNNAVTLDLARYVFTFLLSVAMAITYGMKVVLSMTLVKMVNHTSNYQFSSTDDTAPDPSLDGPFKWNSDIQGYMLSSYFGGYMFSQIPGGYIATNFSSKWVIFFCVAINAICCILVPLCSNIHWGLVVLLRIGKGVGGGVSFPGTHAMLAAWAPIPERSLIGSISYAGTSLGTVVSLLFSGLIAASIGWEAVFYIFGGLSLIWCVLWIIFAADTPSKLNNRLIRSDERDYIIANIDQSHGSESKKVPLKSIFKSKPFWAIMVAHFCGNWGWYILLIETPIYLNEVLHFKLSENAALVSIPYFLLWIFTIILGKTLDHLIEKGKITRTTARKLAANIAAIIPMICLILLCFSSGSRKFAVTVIIIGTTFYGAMFCSWITNHIDISPHYAGFLMGITNTVASIPGITVPIIIGKVTKVHKTIKEWRIPFLLAVGFLVVLIVVYNLMASGEVEEFDSE